MNAGYRCELSKVKDVAKHAGHFLFLVRQRPFFEFVIVVAVIVVVILLARRRFGYFLVGAFNNFVEFTTVKPHPSTFGAVVNFNSLAIGHHQGNLAVWTLHLGVTFP